MTVDAQLRSACQDRCGGDPPCFEMDKRAGKDWVPCDDCLRECGLPTEPEPRDPNAAVKDMFE